MNRRHWIPLLGALGLAGTLSACNGPSGNTPSGNAPSGNAASGNTANLNDADLRTYLGSQGRLKAWLDTLRTAVCELETKHKGQGVPALDDDKRMCSEPGGPPSKGTAPSYPPAQ
jgi:hypothetical protein